MEYPQTNGQAKADNRVLLIGLKRRLKEAERNCAIELSHVLWAHHSTPQSTIGEITFPPYLWDCSRYSHGNRRPNLTDGSPFVGRRE